MNSSSLSNSVFFSFSFFFHFCFVFNLSIQILLIFLLYTSSAPLYTAHKSSYHIWPQHSHQKRKLSIVTFSYNKQIFSRLPTTTNNQHTEFGQNLAWMHSSNNPDCWEQDSQHGESSGLRDRGGAPEQHGHSANREYIEVLLPGEKGELPTDPKVLGRTTVENISTSLLQIILNLKLCQENTLVQIHMIMLP